MRDRRSLQAAIGALALTLLAASPALAGAPSVSTFSEEAPYLAAAASVSAAACVSAANAACCCFSGSSASSAPVITRSCRPGSSPRSRQGKRPRSNTDSHRR